jgi:hypothetical protein
MGKTFTSDFLASDLCVLCDEQFPAGPHDKAESSQQWLYHFHAGWSTHFPCELFWLLMIYWRQWLLSILSLDLF